MRVKKLKRGLAVMILFVSLVLSACGGGGGGGGGTPPPADTVGKWDQSTYDNATWDE